MYESGNQTQPAFQHDFFRRIRDLSIYIFCRGATNVHYALDILNKNVVSLKPDLIIMDTYANDMAFDATNGMELFIRRVRSLDLPLIILAGAHLFLDQPTQSQSLYLRLAKKNMKFLYFLITLGYAV